MGSDPIAINAQSHMNNDNTIKSKWNKRYSEADDSEPQAAQVLRDNTHLLPDTGHALDLACGRGGNALLMARAGLQVDAWDISDVVVGQLQQYADEQQLPLSASVHDAEASPPQAGQYDVIAVSYFLDRDIIAQLIAALKPGGLIFYQTFARAVISARGPQSPAYRLADNELLGLFSNLQVLVYREEIDAGDSAAGIRDEAMLIARKP